MNVATLRPAIPTLVLLGGLALGCSAEDSVLAEAGEQDATPKTSGKEEEEDSSQGKSSEEKDSGELGFQGSPTWYEQVAPLLSAKCSQCHEEGGIAPFSLESYESAKPWAEAIAEVVEDGSMPPFLAHDTEECTPLLDWKDDLRLSAREKSILRAWADTGAELGKEADAAPLVPPTPLTLEREDVILRIPGPISVAGTKDLHTCTVIDPQLAEDVYVKSRLIHSGNPTVLHHVVSYVLEPPQKEDGTPGTKEDLEQALMAERGVGIGGRYDCFGGPGLEGVEFEILDAWAPGGVPNDGPPNSGQPVSKESLVILDLHYHPTGAGKEVDEDTYLALTLTEQTPPLISRTVLLGNFGAAERDLGAGIGRLIKQEGESQASFDIPAGASEHVEEMTFTLADDFPATFRVYGAGTHMHYVGYDMQVTLEKKDEEPECVIHTPAWDFNWQRGYAYDAPITSMPSFGPGDTLRMRCLFNNSMSNPHVVEALADQGLSSPISVKLGDDTLDEMCLVALGIVHPNL